MKKNTTNQVVDFLMLSVLDGSAVTTGTPVVYYKGDGGTQVLGTGTKVHKGRGEWEYKPTQAETNYNHVAFLMTLTGAFSQVVNVYTTYPQTGDAYTVANDIKNKTDNLPTDPADQSLIAAAITSAHGTTDSILSAILADTGTDIPALINALNDPDAASIADAVLDDVLTDLVDNSLNNGQTITLRKATRAMFNRFFREVTQTVDTQIVKNDSGDQIAVMTVSDDDTIQIKGSAS